jgi:HAMP domain-containing protein
VSSRTRAINRRSHYCRPIYLVISNLLFSGITTSVEKHQFALVKSIIEFNLKSAEGKALARAAMIADAPKAKALFAARDRAGLLAEYQPMFQIQNEKYGVDQAQFHLPDNISFLRLHNPEKFGDDLTKTRPMVVAANRDQSSKKGFAISRTGPAIFGVVPMFDANRKHIGSFEIGIAFEGILDSLKAAYGFDLAVFIKEEALKAQALGIEPGIYSDQNRLGQYIRYHSTNAALIKGVVADSDLNASDGGMYVREALGGIYGVVVVPLRNIKGDALGRMVAAIDLGDLHAAQDHSLVWQMLMALFAIVFMAGFILVVIRGVLLRPLQALTANFTRLADGDINSEASTPEHLCEELEALAVQYERLADSAKEKQ